MIDIADVKLLATAHLGIAKARSPGPVTPEQIREAVTKAIRDADALEFVDPEQLIAEFERDYNTRVGEALTLLGDEDEWSAWLPKQKSEIDWRFWQRYRTYLLKRKNYPKTVVDSIDDVTDETLGNLVDPKKTGPWDRRGMVVGHVQAGKTTNYAGLICKAADSGYKVVIVLTGFHNNLRTQTQIRLEEAFIGYDRTASQEQGPRVSVGVGEDSSDPNLRVDTITNRSEQGDFRRTVANHFGMNPGGRPLVFVIKKNASVLGNLVKYLESVHSRTDAEGRYFISDIPLLLIDDEADQGSVDTKKMDFDSDGDPDSDHDPTKINGLIRRVLSTFTQSAYVGYTATPFANIFIHHEASSDRYGEDLFPRSFITVMPTASNYVGPARVFGLAGDDDGESRQPGLPIRRPISDYAASCAWDEKEGWMPPRHDKHHQPLYGGRNEIPPSLRKAVLSFLLGCSVRVLRGQGTEHNSMLIHVTRFVDVQERVFDQVNSYVRDVKHDLLYGEEGSREELLRDIESIWEEDFVSTSEQISDPLCPVHSWAEVGELVVAAAQSIRVRRINGSAADVLDYETYKETGLNVIAIGGDKLSRGLTLEGLTVSYFSRPSRMYDTLMQMGRWFGYRDGFLDVCRLFAPAGLLDWFEHITDASEQLRREFLLMCEIGGNPATYGQRVRSHPMLMVTSAVKMRHSTELTLSYQGAISETIVFSRVGEIPAMNQAAASKLIGKIMRYSTYRQSPLRDSSSKVTDGKYLWSGVEVDDILEFLRQYETPQHVRRVNADLLSRYIENQVANGDLQSWSVMLAGKSPIQSEKIELAGISTGLLKRSNHPVDPDPNASVYRIRRLVSPADEAWDLSADQYTRAQALCSGGTARLGGEEIRTVRDRTSALFILYPLEHQPDSAPIESLESCYVGFAISFPGIKEDKPVSYRVNQVYQEQFDG